MNEPQYRRRLQALADLLVAAAPDEWSRVVLHAGFRSEVATDLRVRYFEGTANSEQSVEVPFLLKRELAKSAREVRSELVRAGNPECKALTFTLSSTGESAIDVGY